MESCWKFFAFQRAVTITLACRVQSAARRVSRFGIASEFMEKGKINKTFVKRELSEYVRHSTEFRLFSRPSDSSCRGTVRSLDCMRGGKLPVCGQRNAARIFAIAVVKVMCSRVGACRGERTSLFCINNRMSYCCINWALFY